MKAKQIIRNVMLATCLSSVIMTAVPTWAAGLDELGMTVDGSLLTNELQVNADSNSLLRGNYLSYGTVSLVNNEDGTVGVGGSTVAHVICDKLYLTMTLQQKVGNDWYDYRTWQSTRMNAGTLSKSYTVEVPSGFYYRVQGAHLVEENGDNSESQVTHTDGIWIEYED